MKISYYLTKIYKNLTKTQSISEIYILIYMCVCMYIYNFISDFSGFIFFRNFFRLRRAIRVKVSLHRLGFFDFRFLETQGVFNQKFKKKCRFLFVFFVIFFCFFVLGGGLLEGKLPLQRGELFGFRFLEAQGVLD